MQSLPDRDADKDSTDSVIEELLNGFLPSVDPHAATVVPVSILQLAVAAHTRGQFTVEEFSQWRNLAQSRCKNMPTTATGTEPQSVGHSSVGFLSRELERPATQLALELVAPQEQSIPGALTKRLRRALDNDVSCRTAKRIAREENWKLTRYTVSKTDVVQLPMIDVLHLRFSRPGWKGTSLPVPERNALKDFVANKNVHFFNLLRSFSRIAFSLDPALPPQRTVRVLDCDNRLFILRTNRPEWIVAELPTIARVVEVFCRTAMSDPDKREDHNRGSHNFSIMGYDRNNKQVPNRSRWERRRHARTLAKEELMDTPVMKWLHGWVASVVRTHLPDIASRLQNCLDQIRDKYGVEETPFGLWWNFCINTPIFDDGIKNVFCAPHVDAQNGALLVCAVFVFYYGTCKTNADERIWLVIWEAGLIIQVPAGVLIVFPSALLLHFNVNINDVLFVTSDGSYPTADNTVPLGQDNELAGGRASMVWFTQATMLMSAELPCDTKKEADKRKDVDSAFNYQHAIQNGAFPPNVL